MKNKILILVTVIGLASLVFIAVLFLKNKQSISEPTSTQSLPNAKNSTPSATDTLITSNVSNSPTDSKISIPSSDSKGSISVDNYYNAPSSTVIDDKDVLIGTNKNFDILAYDYNNEKTFLIYLKNSEESLETTRKNAESVFIEKLGITKEQACLLVVSERLADDIKGSTTEDYGLSFCPNGKKIPISN
ncbi:MAG: hypothetical protein WCF93_01465 [Candidatus Moraniibacteriota bacterium]